MKNLTQTQLKEAMALWENFNRELAIRGIRLARSMTSTEFGEIRCHIMNQHPDWQRFNCCQAWITPDNYTWNGRLYKLVKSYSTIVGIIDIRDDILWWERKYSPTTSKQLTQIANRYHLTKQQTED